MYHRRYVMLEVSFVNLHLTLCVFKFEYIFYIELSDKLVFMTRGGMHYQSFDGKEFSFKGTCSYVMVDVSCSYLERVKAVVRPFTFM